MLLEKKFLEGLSFVLCSRSSTISFANWQHSPGVSAGLRERSLLSSARCFADEISVSLFGPPCFCAFRIRRPFGLSIGEASFTTTGELVSGVGSWLEASSPRTQRWLIADNAIPCTASVWCQKQCRQEDSGSAKSESKHRGR